eukprot:jgi/Orpsp1_1/1175975/evm.model.c7180000055921.1
MKFSLILTTLTTLGLAKLSNAACGGAYAQCGGNDYSGENCCVEGYKCVKLNDWYSNCLPESVINDSNLEKRQWDWNNW